MKSIDLHTHSEYSDGSMSPSELVAYAKEHFLSAIALCDHDCIGGVREAVSEGEKLGVEVVPAVEFAARGETETHILGYYIDTDNKEINQSLNYICKVRAERMSAICQSLQNIGIDVTVDEVKKVSGNGILCRAHIARLIVEKGYAPTVREAFSRYLHLKNIAHSETQALTDREVIEIINNAGGQAFLAHPHLTKKPDDELFEYLKLLKSYGLRGLEGYYTDYTPKMQEKYQAMAKKLNLEISGGTDFHGSFKPDIEIGIGHGNMQIPYSVLQKIKDAHE